MNNLSERQRKILQFITDFVSRNEFPPTIREIGLEVGISSTSVVNYNLAKLEELGLITRRKEVSRGLSLNWDLIRTYNLDLRPASVSHSSHTNSSHTNSSHTNGSHTNGQADTATAERSYHFTRIPVLGAIAAGQPIQVEALDERTTDEFVEVPEGAIKARGRLFALRVKGDSMIDASVLNGDIVVLRHQETANDGDMIAAWIEGDDETTLKYLYREGREIRLQPANPAYAPIMRPPNKVRIAGTVVFIMRTLEH